MPNGLIPRPFIDELLSRTDIVEFIDSYVPLKKQGTSQVACCPFHNEKTPHSTLLKKNSFIIALVVAPVAMPSVLP